MFTQTSAFFKVAAVLALIAVVSPVSAQTVQERRAEIESRIESIREQASSTKTEVHEALEESDVAEACLVVVERVESRLEAFTKTHTEHEQAYEAHLGALQTISSKLEVQGLDVSDLNSDIAVLEVKIAKFKVDKDTVIAALEATKAFSCVDSDEKFRESVTVARDAQKMLLEDSIDILSFIRTAIKKDLEELRAQYKQSNS